MIAIRLHLLVDDTWVPAEDVLRGNDPIDVDSSTLSLMVDGTEHLLGMWNLGRVDLITTQAEDAARWLRSGEPAILRSGVLGRQGVPFHLFEPPDEAGGPAHVSRFFIDDPDVESWFPIAGWGSDDPTQLFDWVAAHRGELLTPEPAERRRKPPLVRLPVHAHELVDELEQLAVTGRTVLEAAAERAQRSSA